MPNHYVRIGSCRRHGTRQKAVELLDVFARFENEEVEEARGRVRHVRNRGAAQCADGDNGRAGTRSNTRSDKARTTLGPRP